MSQTPSRETIPPAHLDETAAASTSQLTPEQITALQAKNAELERQLEQTTQALAVSEACRRMSEAKLNGILNSAIAAIASFRAFKDREWQYEYRSAGCEVVFGYTAEEFLSDPELWRSRVVPDDFATVIVPAFAAIFAEQTTQVEYRFQHKDGTVRWISESLTSCRDEAADCWIVTTVATDITDGKRAEAALRESENRLQAAQQLAHCGSWEFEVATQKITWSDELFRIFGLNPSASELDYEEHLLQLHPEDREQVRTSFERLLATGIPIYIEYRVLRPDRSVRHLEARGGVLYDEEGNVFKAFGTAIDITERKQIEAELSHSRDFIQRITDDSSQVLYIFDLVHQRSIYVNRQVAVVLGYTQAELEQQGAAFFVDRWHPDDLPQIQQVLQNWENVADGEVVELEYRMRHKDGSWRWLRGRDVVFERDATGRPTKTLGTAIDVSDRKQVEAALHQSEQHYALAVNAGKVGVWDWNLETNEISVDPVLKALLGYEDSEIKNHMDNWGGLVHPDDQPAMLAVTRAYLDGQTSIFEMEQRMIHKEGNLRWFLARGTALRDASGTPYRVLGTHTDITERKQLELALQASEAKLSRILNSAGAVIASFRLFANRDLNYEFFSSGSQAILGYLPEELKANKTLWMSRIHPEDLEQVIFPVFEDLFAERITTIEFRFRHKDGSQRWISSTLISRRDESADCWAVTCVEVDISDRKQAELALQRQLAKEQTLNRLIQAIRHSLDLKTIFSTAVTEVANFLQVDQAALVQYLPERNLWLVVDEYLNNLDIPSMRELAFPDAGNLITSRIKQLDVVRLNHTSEFEVQDTIYQEMARVYPGAWLFVPLQIGTRVWGGLGLMHYGRSYTWQDAEVELLQAMVDQIAIAIQQSELYQQVQQFNANLEQLVEVRTSELEHALHREATLKEITDAVRHSLDEAQILQTVVQELGTALSVIGCATTLYTADDTVSTLRYDYTLDYPAALEQTIALSDYAEEFQWLSRGQLLQFCFLDSVSNPVYPELISCTIFACPILNEQEVLGALWLFKTAQQVFDHSDVRLVEQVANQCAIALRQSRLYQEIQSHAKELESLNTLKDEFLSTVSHELRSPMANVKMATQMLEVCLTLDERSDRYFQILKEECDREINLINDLLDLSRLESGLLELDLTTLVLQDWIPHVAEAFEERTSNQEQQLLYHFAPNLSPFVTDAFYLQRILTELLQNACKYTPINEQIVVSAEVENHGKSSKNTSCSLLKISVTNTGIEIPEQERDRVFDKFYRIHNNDPWQHDGTGLGLALVKKLVECLGGTIQLECFTGKTTFTLSFLMSN